MQARALSGPAARRRSIPWSKKLIIILRRRGPLKLLLAVILMLCAFEEKTRAVTVQIGLITILDGGARDLCPALNQICFNSLGGPGGVGAFAVPGGYLVSGTVDDLKGDALVAFGQADFLRLTDFD